MGIGFQSKSTGKILYAVAYETVHKNGTIDPGFVYMHAQDAGEVFLTLYRQRSSGLFRRGTRVVSVAPAIGAEVDETTGKTVIL